MLKIWTKKKWETENIKSFSFSATRLISENYFATLRLIPLADGKLEWKDFFFVRLTRYRVASCDAWGDIFMDAILRAVNYCFVRPPQEFCNKCERLELTDSSVNLLLHWYPCCKWNFSELTKLQIKDWCLTYVYLIESPQKLFAIRTERGLAEKFWNKFVAINFVDSVNILFP